MTEPMDVDPETETFSEALSDEVLDAFVSERLCSGGLGCQGY